MSLHTVRKCDECRSPRVEASHWWAAIGGARRPQFLTAKAADAAKGKPRGFRLDFCSHKCVTSAFNRWLDTGSVVRQRIVHVEATKPSEALPGANAPTMGDMERYLDDPVVEEYAKLV